METKACRQCGTCGDDSMESYAKDMCGYCSDAGNVALVWADADKAVEQQEGETVARAITVTRGSQWDTVSSFGNGEHYTQYQENRYNGDARLLVAGREVVPPRYDTESVHNQYNALYGLFVKVIHEDNRTT